MPISFAPPATAVNPTCRACGSATYCGGAGCPSNTLQGPPDQNAGGMVNETYISVAIRNPLTGKLVAVVA